MDEDVPTYEELYKMAFEVAAKFGTIYFDNLLIDGKNKENSVSCTQCCAYSFKSDDKTDNKFNKKLNFVGGEHFKLGGMQVVSINLPRCAYQANGDKKILIARIYDMMDKAVEIFKIKQKLIMDQAANGSLSYINQITPKGVRFTDFKSLVFEMGIVGLNEMVEHFTCEQLHESENSRDLAKSILAQMSEYCKMASDTYNMKIVLARTPAETTAQRFAVCDMMDDRYKGFAELTVKGDKYTAKGLIAKGKTRDLPVFYSNGISPSIDAPINLSKKIKIESELWPYLDGESNPSAESLMNFALRIAQKTNIGYFAFSKNYSQCEICHHITDGIAKKCEKCGGEKLIIFARITGYLSAAGMMEHGIFKPRWNAAKATELFMRHDDGKDM